MSPKYLAFLIILANLVFYDVNAWAALRSKSSPGAGISPEAAYNPKADPGDLELPMPNGQKLVLRAVAIPGKGFLNDAGFKMGLMEPGDDRDFYESHNQAHVSSPIRKENLPPEWQKKLNDEGGADFSYYFIGKYELSNGQWAAVMGEEVDGPPDHPRGNISWYDVQDFLRKYNEWLLKNHPESIPEIDKTPAFLRLPTEAEWEYAARGGAVPPEQRDFRDYPWEDGKAQDYAIFNAEKPMPIGSRKPNDLGIYDMAGNLAELVQDGFRFTIMEMDGNNRKARLHGSEGGPLAKGGYFLSTQPDDLYPGKRVEIRMFEKQPDNSYIPHKDRGLGARLVLASINVPGMKRAAEIEKEKRQTQKQATAPGEKQPEQPAIPAAKKASGDAPGITEGIVSINIEGDPEEELQKLYEATKSPLMKSNLSRYRELIRGYNEAFNRERDANLLSMVRSAAYKADSLSNIAFRCYELRFKLDDVKRQDPKFYKEMEHKVMNEILRHFKNLRMSTNFYLQSVQEVSQYPDADVKAKIAQLKKEYGGSDQVNEIFRRNLDIFAGHVDLARKQGPGKLKASTIWDQYIPNKKARSVISALEKSPAKGK